MLSLLSLLTCFSVATYLILVNLALANGQLLSQAHWIYASFSLWALALTGLILNQFLTHFLKSRVLSLDLFAFLGSGLYFLYFVRFNEIFAPTMSILSAGALFVSLSTKVLAAAGWGALVYMLASLCFEVPLAWMSGRVHQSAGPNLLNYRRLIVILLLLSSTHLLFDYFVRMLKGL